ncbi:hypothetical protein [Kitasatospora sp. NPDC094011]|uniref:hypothetical protein n=1 Tax=Kitasatospora sp. NPDC094011 TaxID=3364090 RepID=UPI00381FF734
MKFVTNHPARIYAVFVAALALVAHYVPSLPSALVLALVAAVLSTGEAVQRAENTKTAQALAAEPTSAGADQAEPADTDPYEVL